MFPGSKVTLLLLLLSESVRTSSVGPSLLQHPITRVRVIEVEDDYDDKDSVTTLSPRSPGATTPRVSPPLCEYDPCVFSTSPCAEISAQTGCLCPGLSGPEERPAAPKLREIKPDRSGLVVVHWCAPLSTVTRYKVNLRGGDGKQQVFGENLRNGAVPGLKVGETVCVSAVNEAGDSEESCAQYEPPGPEHAALSAGLIAGGVCVLVLLIVLAVLLWRRRSCGKGSMSEAGGLGNPSYTNDGVL